MLRQKIEKERMKKEIEKICEESEELKELRETIQNSYLNKERVVQIGEKQYQIQKKLEDEAELELNNIKII